MYHIVKSTRQYGESHTNISICPDSEEESLSAAILLAKLFATVHTKCIVMADPKPAGEGEYWFFTPNNTYVTYFVKKKT